MTLDDVSLKAQNVKCFGETPHGFERIKPINIAIGRNNSGKSTLLDLVQFAVDQKTALKGHAGQDPEAIIEIPNGGSFGKLSNNHVEIQYGNFAQNINLKDWARDHYANGRLVCASKAGTFRAIGISGYEPQKNDLKARAVQDRILRVLSDSLPQPFQGYRYRRVLAERDVAKENMANHMDIAPNGRGLTSVLRGYLTRFDLDRDFVEISFRDELNEILRPDSDFARIGIRDLGNDYWELYLDELKKERSIPLSQTGSGLKTVMIVLANLMLIPHIEKQPPKQYIFAFEELENNLHPAAQRRLFRYIHNYALRHGCYFFLTTHSNVVIDMFANCDTAQIVHVDHDGQRASVNSFTSSKVGWRILDDLDVRASDILQANAIIWIEGPSDRIYLERWITLWSDERLLPGVHYQCLPFGGSSEKHYCFDDPEVVTDLIAALKVNRHAIVVADSDKRTDEASLKPELERIVKEVVDNDGVAFVTAGKEIENYIPVDAWRALADADTLKGPSRYNDAVEYGRTHLKPKPSKVELARQVSNVVTVEMLRETLDLAERLDELCMKIRQWNRFDSDYLPV